MKATIVAIIPEGTNTYSFYLEPEGEIKYKAGDFIYLSLPLLHYPDLRGNIRQFSLASSPSEGNILRITSHEGLSGYKKTLMDLRAGDLVDVDGGHGVYPWPYPEDTPHVFIAGGIGITPFRSRIKFHTDKKLPLQYSLIYSFKNLDKALFLDELKNKNTHIITTENESRINQDYLEPIVNKNEDAIFWVTGSTAFVSDIEKMLYNLGIKEDRVKTEKFTGY